METWVKSCESVIHPKYFSSVYIWTRNDYDLHMLSVYVN